MMGRMDKPLQRVLAALELLQAHPGLTGAELAQRLDVDRRTVRRYIVELEKFGVPIQATRGRDGNYALMPGYKLPPLMFSNDESLALSVGLRVARELGLSGMTPAVASAQAKLDRVMPKTVSRKVGDLNSVVMLDLSRPQADSNGSAFFAEISQCASRGQRLQMHYHALNGSTTERELDAYGLGYLYGAWYVVGYCHTRRAMRSFRLDRVLAIAPLPKSFARPAHFDVLAYLRESIAALPRKHAVVVRFAVSLPEVRHAIPPSTGKLTAQKNGIRLDAQMDDLHHMARQLAGLRLPFEIVQPPALKTVLKQHLQQLLLAHG